MHPRVWSLAALILTTLCLTRSLATGAKPIPPKAAAPEFGLMLTTDQTSYTIHETQNAIPQMRATLTVVNRTKKPLQWLEHGQKYSWQIVDAQGKTVWDYAQGKRFPKFVRQRTLVQGTAAYSCDIPLQTQAGPPLTAGHYTLRGRILGFDGAAELGFTVTGSVIDSPHGAGLQ